MYQFSTLPDVIVLTETWLYPAITDSEIGLHDYNIYRCDRPLLEDDNSFGGGVLVAVKRHILSTLCTCTAISCDQLFVKFHLSTNTKIIIGAVYPLLVCPLNAYGEHLDTALTLQIRNEDCDFLVLGDFNLPKIVWTNSPVLRYNLLPLSNERIVECAEVVKNGISFLNMTQYFPSHPHKSYTLDLLFTSIHNPICVEASDILVPIDKHHIPHCFTIKSKTIEYTQPQDMQYNFN